MVAQRLALGLLTVFIVSLVIFGAVELLPGDAAQAILGNSATPETIAALREQLRLDLPMVQRYGIWLGNLLQGDFGKSFSGDKDIYTLVETRLANTFFLAAYSAALSVPLGLGLGMMSALWRGKTFDKMSNVATLTMISFPEFFVAYILVYLLAIKVGILPSISNINPDMTFFQRVYRTTLPALTLTMVTTAYMMRMTRAAIVHVMSNPYIEMARLKGASPTRLVLVHALPNALAPIINVIAITLAYLIVGVVIVEVIFVYPGLGQLLVDSVSKRDFPVVQAACLIFAVIYVLLNLIADVLSIISNPRLLHPK